MKKAYRSLILCSGFQQGKGDSNFGCTNAGGCHTSGYYFCVEWYCQSSLAVLPYCSPRTGVECNLFGCYSFWDNCAC